MAILEFLSYALGENRTWEGTAGLRKIWLLKMALQLPIFNPMSPLRSVYYHPFYKNLKCPRDIPYNPCPEEYEGVLILKDIISGLLNYVRQNNYLEILTGSVWGNDGRGGWLPSNHFWLLKKVQALSITNRLSLFRIFYDYKWPS